MSSSVALSAATSTLHFQSCPSSQAEVTCPLNNSFPFPLAPAPAKSLSLLSERAHSRNPVEVEGYHICPFTPHSFQLAQCFQAHPSCGVCENSFFRLHSRPLSACAAFCLSLRLGWPLVTIVNSAAVTI